MKTQKLIEELNKCNLITTKGYGIIHTDFNISVPMRLLVEVTEVLKYYNPKGFKNKIKIIISILFT